MFAIDNPAIGGWIAVAIYSVAIISCWLTLCESGRGTREKRVWWFIVILLLALAITRQFDLQAALTESGRMFARSEGWYFERRPIQFEFIIGLALICVAVTSIFWNWAKRIPQPARIALAAITLVTGYVLIRTVSLHRVDGLIGRRVLGISWNWILEMGGVGVVLLASLWRRHRQSADNRADTGGTR
jgi:hypothetical protein